MTMKSFSRNDWQREEKEEMLHVAKGKYADICTCQDNGNFFSDVMTISGLESLKGFGLIRVGGRCLVNFDDESFKAYNHWNISWLVQIKHENVYNLFTLATSQIVQCVIELWPSRVINSIE